MEELITRIAEQCTAFNADAHAQAEKGNKAAGLRARKLSLEIEKNLKEFRKQSLEQEKK